MTKKKTTTTTAISTNVNFGLETNSNIEILNDAVTKLATINFKEGVSEKDRDNAIEIIDQWEMNTVEKYKKKEKTIKEIICALKSPSSYENEALRDEKIGELIDLTADKFLIASFKEMKKYKEEKKQHDLFEKVVKPDSTFENKIEEINTMSDYKKKVKIFNIKSSRFTTLIQGLRLTITSELFKTETIKVLINNLEKERKETAKIRRAALLKATLAKTNIKIAEEDLKLAILDILKF